MFQARRYKSLAGRKTADRGLQLDMPLKKILNEIKSCIYKLFQSSSFSSCNNAKLFAPLCCANNDFVTKLRNSKMKARRLQWQSTRIIYLRHFPSRRGRRKWKWNKNYFFTYFRKMWKFSKLVEHLDSISKRVTKLANPFEESVKDLILSRFR